MFFFCFVCYCLVVMCAGSSFFFFFFFNDTATTEIYTFPYTTLFRSWVATSCSPRKESADVEHSFTWVSIIPGLNLLPTHTATATVVIAALLVWALVGLRQLRAASDPVIPDGTLTARNSLEVFVEWFVGFIEGLLGHKGRTFV